MAVSAKTRTRLIAILGLAAQLGCTPASTAPTDPPPSDARAPRATSAAAIMLGAWSDLHAQSSERWVAVGEHLVGVGFAGDFFEVMLIHPVDGGQVFTAMPMGASQVDFAITLGDEGLRADNPGHDDPRTITYRRSDAGLAVSLDGEGGPRAFELSAVSPTLAPELERLDAEFAADSLARGGVAWGERFIEAGCSWPLGSARSEGPTTIAAGIDEMRTNGRDLLWTPLVGGLAPDGERGFTAGTYEIRGHADDRIQGTGTYVTIWQREGSGWRIVFDTGVADPPSAAAPPQNTVPQ